MASSSATAPAHATGSSSQLTPEQKLGIYRQIVGIPQYSANGFGPLRSASDIERDAPDREDVETTTNHPTNGKGPLSRTTYQPLNNPSTKRKKPRIWTRWWHILLPYKDPPRNQGIYHHILYEEGTTTLYSYVAYTLITFFLLLQVVVAAIITSLSAWGNHRIPLIALGATNTILASILAWLKGQGLPNRTIQYRYAMGRVRLQAELMDAKFQCRELSALLDPLEEGQHIVNMYIAAKSDAEKNQPDFYSMDSEWQTSKNRQLAKEKASTAGTAGMAAKGDDALRAEIANVIKVMNGLAGTLDGKSGAAGSSSAAPVTPAASSSNAGMLDKSGAVSSSVAPVAPVTPFAPSSNTASSAKPRMFTYV